MKVKVLVAGLIALIGILGVAMNTSKTEVPKAVKEAFAKKYPDAKEVRWEMEDEDEFEAEFELDGNEMSATFKGDGTWLETEMEIDTDSLPQAVLAAIASQFADYELESAEQIERPNRTLSYEVELENQETDEVVIAIFAADGKLMKKQVEDEDEDDDGDDGDGK